MTTETLLDPASEAVQRRMAPLLEAARTFTDHGWPVYLYERPDDFAEVGVDIHLTPETLDMDVIADALAKHPQARLAFVVKEGYAVLYHTPETWWASSALRRQAPPRSSDQWSPPSTFQRIHGPGFHVYLLRLNGTLTFTSRNLDPHTILVGQGTAGMFGPDALTLPNPESLARLLSSAPMAPMWVKRFTVGYTAPEPKVDHRRSPANEGLDERILDAIWDGAESGKELLGMFAEEGRPVSKPTLYRVLGRLQEQGRVSKDTPLRVLEPSTPQKLWDDEEG